MSRSHGELFLLADRKNRMERARLDRRLGAMDRDCARHQFLIERQKKSLVTKWSGVCMTTGHSDKALPPDGPHDNVYEKCKYNLSRLSEKRLMEWKVRERQLDKFLRQFRPPRPASGPASTTTTTTTTTKPRPSSSRSERPTSSTSRGDRHVSGTASAKSPAVTGRVRSARAVLQHEVSQPRRRCASAVSFSSRTRVISLEDDVDCLSEGGEKDVSDDVEDGDRGGGGGGGDKVFETRLRSLSMVSLPQHYARAQHVRCPTARPRLSDSASRTAAREAFRDCTLASALNTAEVIEQFKSSAKMYEDFIRTQSVPETKFFITKDNVVMTDATQHKCRQISVSSSVSDQTEKPSRQGEGRPCSDPKEEPASHTDRVSLSSVSSEDMADSVFLTLDDQAKTYADELPHTGNTHTVHETSAADLTPTNTVSANPTQTKQCAWALRQDSLLQDKAAECQNQSVTNGQSSAPAMEQGACQNADINARAPRAPLPAQRPSVGDKRTAPVRERRGGGHVGHNRRHSCHPALQHAPCTGDGVVVGEGNSKPSPHNPLMKRRQSKTTLPHSASAADPPSVASAMIITSLSSKETDESDLTPNKPNESAVRRSRPLSAKPPRPCSRTSQADIKLKSPSQSSRNQQAVPGPNQHNRNPPPDTKLSSTLNQHNKNLPADPKTTQLQHKDAPTGPKPHPNRSTLHRPPQTTPNNKHASDSDDKDDDDDDNTSEDPPAPRAASQWRRDLDLEQPAGLRSRVSTLGTVLKAAMVFSKTARRKALSSLVDDNNQDCREAVRRERLRTLQSRASVLSKIVAQFPVHGGDG
ncbi:uncharacterized protein LOC143297681 [Babylonia areolata]|uniref:uncharacterized protein LOC143297681 n=1 Tax=Babylonia areolata TaxID=304850 RepID=UPI003FD6678D